jgi:hypothetical protein
MLIGKAAASGFDTSKLIFVDHGTPRNKAHSVDGQSSAADERR